MLQGSTLGKQRLAILALGGLLLLSLALTFFRTNAPASAAGSVFVRPDGDDTNCNGTAAVAYPGGTGPLACAKKTIQGGIDAAAAGDTVKVYPGSYNETASNRTLYNGGTYQFGFYVGQAKSGLTVQGVDTSGNPITDSANVAASVKTNATNNFGYSGVFIEGDNVTISGLKILDNYVAGAVDNNKTVEVIGDNFTLKYSQIAVSDGGAVYISDFRYDAANNASMVKAYRIEGNLFDLGADLTIASGAGVSGPVSGRVITGNKFVLNGASYPAISFSGKADTTGGPSWYTYPVGGAVIQNNDFSGGTTQYIRARGDYLNAQFDWNNYFTANTYDKATIVGANPAANDVRAFTYTSGSYTFVNVRRIGATLQGEISNAASGDTLLAKAGTYPETLIIDKPLTLKGAQAGVLAKNRAGAQSIIKVSSGGTVAADIRASNVTINGFVFNMTGSTPPWAVTALNLPSYANLGLLYNEFISSPGTDGTGGAYLQNTTNTVIEGNYFNQLANHAIFMAANSDGTVYRNNDSYNCYNSNFSAHVGTHKNTLVENNRAVEDDMIIFATEDATFRNNSFTSSAASSSRIYLGGGDKRITVTGNTFTVKRTYAIIGFDPGFGYGPDSDLTITNNTINTDVSTLQVAYTQIDLRGVGGTSLIKGNKITLSGSYTGPAKAAYGIGVRGAGTGTVNITENILNGGNIANATDTPPPSGIIIRTNASGVGALPITAVINVTKNTLGGFANGVSIFDAVNNVYGNVPAGATINVNNNSIAGNSIYGLITGTGASVNAICNWWGSPTGPTNPTNPGGTGDKISDNAPFSPWATTNTYDCAAKAGIATRLIFTTQPGNSYATVAFPQQPVVKAVDNDGNIGINFNGAVTLAIGTNPGAGTLSGTNPVNAVNGVASFSGLSINQPGNGYTLVASASGLSSATSNPFNIQAVPASVCAHPTLTQLSAYRPLLDNNGSQAYPLSNLIDNSNSPTDQTKFGTFWSWTNYPRAVALQIDYGANTTRRVSSLRIYSQTAGKAPNVYFQFSQDTQNWYDIPGLSGLNINQKIGYYEVNFPSAITARAFRAVIENTTYLNDVGYWADLEACSTAPISPATDGASFAKVSHELPLVGATANKGNGVANLLDGKPFTYYSADNFPGSAVLNLDLGKNYTITSLKYFVQNVGTAPNTKIEVADNPAFNNATVIANGVNTGSATGLQTLPAFAPATGRYIRITVTGSSYSLANYSDFQIFGY